MASITFAADEKLKEKLSKFLWINLSELARQALIRKMQQMELLKKLHSKEEQELIKWSVELGRKVKEDSFKRLLSEVSPERKKRLLGLMSPEKRKKYQ